MRCSSLLAATVLGLPLAAPAGEQASRAGDSPRRLALPRRGEKGDGPLDWVLANVESGRDQWSMERLSDAVNGRLRAVAAALEAGQEPGPALASVLSEGFRGADVLPPVETALLDREGVAAWRGEPRSAAPGLDRTAWAARLAALAAVFAAVGKASFKVFAVSERGGGEGGLSTQVLLEMDGRAPRGLGHQQVRAVWELEWSEGGEQITGMGLASFERAVIRDRPFREVTDAALGANASYRDQLSRGVDHWRTRMDSASGIDIYGHQGIAVGDIDGDGWEDFHVSQPAGLPNRLFRNLGDGRFADVTAEAGVGVLDDTGGALFLDLDNDGDQDLVVATALEVLLFENRGRGAFARRARCGLEAASRRSASTLGLAAADHDRDGDLDLYVVSYIFWAGAGSKLHSSYPYPYHDANNGAPNFLFRNDGGLRFSDVTRESGMDENNRRFSLAASWCDFDDDGDPDLYVANDFGKNNLYRNDGSGCFRDVAEDLGVEDTGNGMSVTWEDYDNDGRLDLYVGNMWSSAGNRIAFQPGFATSELRGVYQRMARGNSLFRNLGGGRFEDVSLAAGAWFGRWAWSSQFVDFDADGREDLYVVNGFISGESRDDL